MLSWESKEESVSGKERPIVRGAANGSRNERWSSALEI